METGETEAGGLETDQLLDQIAEARCPPIPQLLIAQIRIDEIEPHLLALLTDAADGRKLDERALTLLFYGLCVLGAQRCERAFAPLMRLLRQPDEALDPLFGDALTMTLPQIVAGVFNGDAATLTAMSIDPEVDPFVRRGFLATIAFLTWDRRIDAEETRSFLERFDDERLGDEEGITWDAWAEAAALLSWRDFLPRIKTACNDGRIPRQIARYSDFVKILEQAEADPNDPKGFARARAGYIDNIETALAWIPDPDKATEYKRDYAPRNYEPMIPAINPNRHVGRNDPCPCGSGKKYKKCCLAA